MIKYGELTTKGDNSGTFIKLLEQNIISDLSDYKINVIYKGRSKISVYTYYIKNRINNCRGDL